MDSLSTEDRIRRLSVGRDRGRAPFGIGLDIFGGLSDNRLHRVDEIVPPARRAPRQWIELSQVYLFIAVGVRALCTPAWTRG